MKLSDFYALSFDVYGTLIDWESGMFTALKPLLEQAQEPLGRDEVLQAHSFYESLQQRQTPQRRYQDLLAVVYKRLAEEWGVVVSWDECLAYGQSVKQWPAFPDSAEALAYLKKHFQLFVISNVDQDSFQFSREKLGVTFDGVYTAEDMGAYKPNPANFDYMFQVMNRRGIGKNKLLHVAESMFHDHEPANTHQLASCHIYRRFDKRGFGATVEPERMPRFDFRFNSMAAFADAHRQELTG